MKEIKAFTLYRMESEEVCERYITLCFMEGLDAYDGATDLHYEKILISNEFAVKLRLTFEVMKNDEKVVSRKLLVTLKGELYFVDFVFNPEEDDVEPCVIFGRSFLKLAKAIIDFGNGILTIWLEIITFDSDDDELDALHASINVEDLPPIDIADFPSFECKMGKNLRNKRSIIETLKYNEKHKKLLDSVLLDTLKLDGEFELEEEIVGEELIKGDKVKPRSDKVSVTPLNLGRSEMLNIRGRYFIVQ
ncbi:hypothetical protein Tco_1376076 [Tanacetum coccineum]